MRHITAKQREKKLKSRKPRAPVISKVKKIKMKFYSYVILKYCIYTLSFINNCVNVHVSC